MPRGLQGWVFAAIAALYLALAAYAIVEAPAGNWSNRMYDVTMWSQNDPADKYVPTAHELFSKRSERCFACHPGVPYLVLLNLEQAGLYVLAHRSGVGFTPFIVQHILLVWRLARMSTVLLHFLAAIAVVRLGRLLLGRSDLALWSGVIYATTFPVLYYLTRISVEPLVNIFFVGSVICLLKTGERPAWAAGAGVLAVSAFFTKIHLMALWPLLAALATLTGTGEGWRRRLVNLSYYLSGALLALAAYFPLMDWDTFRQAWGPFAGASSSSAVGFSFQAGTGILSSLVHIWRTTELSVFLPACTKSNCFFLFEFLFLAALPVGILAFLRSDLPRPCVLWWVVVEVLYILAVWFFRAEGTDFHGFHYLFPILATGAPLVALGIARLAPALLDEGRPLGRRVLEMGIVVVVLHYGGFFAVLDEMRQDREAYLKSGSAGYFAALSQAAPSDRIVLIGRSTRALSGLRYRCDVPGREAVLTVALESKFIAREEPKEPRALADKARRWDAGLVLDYTLPDPGPWSLDEWAGRAGSH